jgi:hypothetical protein
VSGSSFNGTAFLSGNYANAPAPARQVKENTERIRSFGPIIFHKLLLFVSFLTDY